MGGGGQRVYWPPLKLGGLTPAPAPSPSSYAYDKFSKNVSSKLYHIENSKIQRTNSVDRDVAAHYDQPLLDLLLVCFVSNTYNRQTTAKLLTNNLYA